MLGTLEEMVLFTIQGLGGEAYSVEIHDKILNVMKRDVSPGALLTTLYRLEKKNLLSSRVSDPFPIPGGRRRRYFSLTVSGKSAIEGVTGRASLLNSDAEFFRWVIV